jgi:hypothetical protein
VPARRLDTDTGGVIASAKSESCVTSEPCRDRFAGDGHRRVEWDLAGASGRRLATLQNVAIVVSLVIGSGSLALGLRSFRRDAEHLALDRERRMTAA